MINFSSQRLNNSSSIPEYFSYQTRLEIRVSESRLYNLSENLLFLSFKENPDCFVFHFATWFLSARTKFVHGSPRFLCVKKAEQATNFLHKSDGLVFGLLILLAPE